mmetsp:Transcript_18385/g.33063  ORF Transcript_18385/g.33063 Transcript_18385/m.33063 type:complete len:225 (-) Transcript_18385:861-1535(-)
MRLNEAIECLLMTAEDSKTESVRPAVALLIRSKRNVKPRKPNLMFVQTGAEGQKSDLLVRNDMKLHSAVSMRHAMSPDSSFSTLLSKCVSPKSSLEGCEERGRSLTMGDEHSMYSCEENELLKRCFMLLVNSQMRMGGTQVVDDKYTVHISALRQFFLECYVTSDHFMSLLLAPYRTITWVSQAQFIRSFDEVHSRMLEPLSLYTEDPYRIKKLFAMQKLFCEL